MKDMAELVLAVLVLLLIGVLLQACAACCQWLAAVLEI